MFLFIYHNEQMKEKQALYFPGSIFVLLLYICTHKKENADKKGIVIDMKQIFEWKTGNPYPLGATVVGDYINFAVSLNPREECGIILYGEKGKEVKVPFSEKNKIGNIYCMMLARKKVHTEKNEIVEEYEDIKYNYYCDDKIIVDSYAKKIVGHEKWGCRLDESKIKGAVSTAEFSWENDCMPRIPYENAILYCMHVRGFTKHHSSKVEGKGTFKGIMEKIPYLKELGITTVKILPAYEFDEVEVEKEKNTMSYAMEHYADQITENVDKKTEKMNYWGYKKGYYFTPKAAYSSDKENPEKELKELIRSLHQENMELVMQFYFPKGIKQGYILEVLRYWVLEYHIDGIHLQGENLPITLIATDPLFSNTKLMYYDFPCSEIYEEGEIPAYRNLASYQDNFLRDMRKYLKSDDDILQSFLFHTRHNPQKEGLINYITNYSGYTLMDLVSYDKKHNEANGENNKDGADYNYSWNCGCEGPCRKKAVQELRIQQIKNALIFLFLSAGTPMLLSGDEFGNTQNGNNNPYCQDNAVSWLNWSLLEKHQEIFQFVKTLIQIRKEHPIFSRKKEAKMMDTLSCGYPDLSYHGEEVWRPIIDNYNRHVAIMHCGKYATKLDGKEDNFFYIAYNMHWIAHTFALPNLPKDKKWMQLLTTGKQEGDMIKQVETSFSVQTKSNESHRKNRKIKKNDLDVTQQECIEVLPRSIVIMISQ